MLNYIWFSVFILTSVIFTYVNPQNTTRQYFIQKDIFSGFKAAEFSVFDTSEKNIHYRLESNYGLTQKVKLIAYPSKQEVGRLRSKITLVYTAEISILDSQTNQWINGLIELDFQFFVINSFNINWNGHRITLKKDGDFSLTWKFYDKHQRVLGLIRRRPGPPLKVRYDLKIFSNKYPEQIYLLGLAALHEVTSARGRG
jgi:hypothetical protein